MFYVIKGYVYGEKLKVGKSSPESDLVIRAGEVQVDSVKFPFSEYKLVFTGARHSLIIDTELNIQGFEFIMQRILETRFEKFEVVSK